MSNELISTIKKSALKLKQLLEVKILKHKLISTIDYTPKRTENNLSSQSTIMKPEKVTGFTADTSKVIDPAVLARIQKSKQEKAAMRMSYRRNGFGTTLKDISSANTPTHAIKHCIKCNEELEIDAQFCSECGIEQTIKSNIIPKISETSEKSYFLEQKLSEADKIYIDTCSLMETPIEKFFEKVNPILKKYNKKIIVILAVELELKKLATSKDEEKQIKAKKVLDNVLYPTINEIKITSSGINDEGMADSAFKSIFEGHRPDNKMLLISQDFDLSKEILEMNNSKAVFGKKCEVCKIDKDGYLKPFENSK